MRTSTLRRLSVAVAITLAALTTWSCGADRTLTAPVAPPIASAQPANLLGIDLGGLDIGLLSCNVTTSYSASKTIGTGGGTLRVGPHTLVVPAGALASNVTITATAPRGRTVEVHFEPEGLRFSKPAPLTMRYSSCGLVNGLLLKVVYVDDDRQRRILEILPSLPNLLSRTVTAPLGHFSNYALAD